MIQGLSLFGSGGHAKVLIEIAQLNGLIVDSLYDDDLKKDKSFISGIQVNAPSNSSFSGYSVVSIGDNKFRKMMVSRIFKARWYTLIHPTAIISKDVVIGEGTVIMAGAIIQAGTRILKHCIINTNASIDHDCFISDFVHISPSATLCGNVKVGEGTHIGAGATIIPNINIGKWCVIGAGAVITNDVPDYSLVVGVPGKIIKKLKND